MLLELSHIDDERKILMNLFVTETAKVFRVCDGIVTVSGKTS
jgi:hypothetical protein